LFSSPELRFCSFENNTVTHWGGRGAGMWVGTGGSAPIIMDTTFSENSVSAGDDGGGGLDAETGTISPTHLTVLDCLFESNAGSRGGGLNCHDATISGCVFWGNSATDRGGAILCHGDVTLTGCTLSRNSTPGHGGGVGINGDAVVEIANCIVASALDGEGIYVYPGYPPPSIACSDIFGNADGDWIEEIADQYGVDGNISEDPLFCDEDAGDVATYDDSPCSPDSSGCGELIGACGVGCFSR